LILSTGNSSFTGLVRSNVFLDVHAIVNNRSQNVKPVFFVPDGSDFKLRKLLF
jgi:hypothetical protein